MEITLDKKILLLNSLVLLSLILKVLLCSRNLKILKIVIIIIETKFMKLISQLYTKKIFKMVLIWFLCYFINLFNNKYYNYSI